ncbi:lysozyme inhibitor LprI family protein [Aliarcobacter butzleri]|uniref:lysozyme inhibitor LprI family protein n=1 Tax=Aliarcobacter TaxID=2321111 RepID=UPI0021B365C1|nr:lysozyme inhibitor LprI family protein [Aliarcobacter butzleri]MCT7573563.1 lysozyme inhibitor LprI family protein [Aliarcobacter butzleri]
MKKIVLTLISTALITTYSYSLDCINAIDTYSLKECANIDYEKADKKLNETYKKVMSTLDDEGKELLKISQRAWIVFRDSNARFQSDSMRGGTGQGLIHISTMTDMTIQREKELSMNLN